MKNELKKGKYILNNCSLNLSEDNTNSITELRKNVLTMELRLGSP